MSARVLLLSAAFLVGACATAPKPGDLPVVELAPTRAGGAPWFAIFVTGDGGWRKIDAKVSDVLRANGIPVVGLLSNRYFARERTPEQTAADLDRLIRDYSGKWNRQRVILVGYSRGADALPIAINRLPAATRRSISVVALLGPAMKGALWIDGPDRYPLLPQISEMQAIPLVCVYGTREKESLCRSLDPAGTKILAVEGGHHFGGDYGRIARTILEALKTDG